MNARARRRTWLTVLGCIILLLQSANVAAQETVVVTNPPPAELSIDGWVGENQSLVGTIRLGVGGGSVKSLSMLADTLVPDEEFVERLGNQNITLPEDTSLLAGVPRDIAITVSGVTVPATYRSTAKLWAIPADGGSALSIQPEIRLTVHARARPLVTPIGGAQTTSNLRTVACDNGVDCSLADALLPGGIVGTPELHDSVNTAQSVVPVQVAWGAPLDVRAGEIVLVGEQTGRTVRWQDAALQHWSSAGSADLQSARQVVFVPVSADNLSNLGADHYTGNLYLRVAQQPSLLAVPLDVRVKTGPLAVLMVLTVSLLCGMGVRYWESRGKALAAAFARLRELDSALSNAEMQHRGVWSERIKDAREAISRNHLEKTGDEPGANALLDEVQTAVNLWQHLGELDTLLQRSKRSKDVIAGLRERIAAAKEKICAGDTEAAANEYEALEGIVRAEQEFAPPAAPGLVARSRLILIVSGVVLILATSTLLLAPKWEGSPAAVPVAPGMSQAVSTPQPTQPQSGLLPTSAQARPAPTPTNKWLVFGAGAIALALAIVAIWMARKRWSRFDELFLRVFVRSWVYVLTLLSLLAVGILTLYVNNPTFGANVFADYLGVFAWGLGADLAGRVLSGLKIPGT
jgi:cell division septation protein DedD